MNIINNNFNNSNKNHCNNSNNSKGKKCNNNKHKVDNKLPKTQYNLIIDKNSINLIRKNYIFWNNKKEKKKDKKY